MISILLSRMVAAAAMSGLVLGQASPPAALDKSAAPDVQILLPVAPPSDPGALVVPKDTLVRLMVLNEVNTHDAHVGDRFVLRVDEDVTIGGVTIIPIGAKAYGEVTNVEENGAVGKAGKIGARLLYVEAGSVHVPLTGERESKGLKGGDRVVLAVVGVGLLGLLARGSQGKLKAGDIFNGYVAKDIVFDAAGPSVVAREPVAGSAIK